MKKHLLTCDQTAYCVQVELIDKRALLSFDGTRLQQRNECQTAMNEQKAHRKRMGMASTDRAVRLYRRLLQWARYAPLHWLSTFTRCEKPANHTVDLCSFYGNFHRGLTNNAICLWCIFHILLQIYWQILYFMILYLHM